MREKESALKGEEKGSTQEQMDALQKKCDVSKALLLQLAMYVLLVFLVVN